MIQGSLVRLLLRRGQTATTAKELVPAVTGDPRHEFWSDSPPFTDVTFTRVIGHRQVTNSYLAQLARTHNGRLATFDRGLAQLHDDVAELLPTD